MKWGEMFDWLKRLLSVEPTVYKRNTPMPEQDKPDPYMDEGDYHSGPEGYSPNTAYPETQYGSMFDEEADWNEEHH